MIGLYIYIYTWYILPDIYLKASKPSLPTFSSIYTVLGYLKASKPSLPTFSSIYTVLGYLKASKPSLPTFSSIYTVLGYLKASKPSLPTFSSIYTVLRYLKASKPSLPTFSSIYTVLPDIYLKASKPSLPTFSSIYTLTLTLTSSTTARLDRAIEMSRAAPIHSLVPCVCSAWSFSQRAISCIKDRIIRWRVLDSTFLNSYDLDPCWSE